MNESATHPTSCAPSPERPPAARARAVSARAPATTGAARRARTEQRSVLSARHQVVAHAAELLTRARCAVSRPAQAPHAPRGRGRARTRLRELLQNVAVPSQRVRARVPGARHSAGRGARQPPTRTLRTEAPHLLIASLTSESLCNSASISSTLDETSCTARDALSGPSNAARGGHGARVAHLVATVAEQRRGLVSSCVGGAFEARRARGVPGRAAAPSFEKAASLESTSPSSLRACSAGGRQAAASDARHAPTPNAQRTSLRSTSHKPPCPPGATPAMPPPANMGAAGRERASYETRRTYSVQRTVHAIKRAPSAFRLHRRAGAQATQRACRVEARGCCEQALHVRARHDSVGLHV